MFRSDGFSICVRLLLCIGAVTALPCTAQSDWGTPVQEEAAARARVDLRRAQIGLPALPLNTQLESAARGHANYLIVNNLSGHFQNAAQYPTGFTGAAPGDRIANAGYAPAYATGEIVARGPFHGEDAVDNLVQAIYHRMGIFSTAIDEQGAGVGQGDQGVTVINFGTRKFPRPTAPPGWVGMYPFDGQAGIAVDFFSDEESPDPVSNLNRVGYPVSLHIDDARVLSVTSFTLAPAGGSAVQAQLLTKAGGDAHMPASAAAIVPLNVLSYGTTYEAKFSGNADGQPLARTWRFTTAQYSSLTIAGPTTAYVGDTVTLKFGGGSGRYVNTGYSYTAAFSQPTWVGDDGYSFRVDSTGSIQFTVTDSENSTAALSIAVKSAAEKLLALATGWNLAGNSSSGTLIVAAKFGDASKVNTVWKWVPAKSNWALYAPSLADGGAAFAASKGYDFLTTIGAGEGFWVNAKTAFGAQLPAGVVVSSAASRAGLISGWNLMAVGDNLTPRGFNNVIGRTAPSAVDIAVNLTTLWTWDAALANWYFYAPSLDKSGGLDAYIQQKSFLNFGTKVLDPMAGFWVNKP